MLIPPRNIQALACCAGACLQSFCTWGNFNRRKWGNFNRRKLGNIQPALTPRINAVTCRQERSQEALNDFLPKLTSISHLGEQVRFTDLRGDSLAFNS